MDKLEAMRVFAQVVTHGGFTAAARAIGLSRSAVSKHVMDLEAALDAPDQRDGSGPRLFRALPNDPGRD